MARRGMGWPLGVAVGFLALASVGASAAHYLQEPYNPGFLDFPTVVALHAVLGGVYLVLALFQFVRRIRSRHLGYHRRGGRLLLAVGVVVGVTALLMGPVISFSGWPERVVVSPFGCLFLRPSQRFRPRPDRAASTAQRMDNPGVRHRARHRHAALALPSRAHHHHGRSDRREVREALGRGVGGGVRRARLCGQALDPRLPQQRRLQSSEVKAV